MGGRLWGIGTRGGAAVRVQDMLHAVEGLKVNGRKTLWLVVEQKPELMVEVSLR